MAEIEDIRSLVEQGAELTNSYLRAGPGSPAAVPVLGRAIEALEKAYRRMEAGDALRGQVAGQLGWLYAMRHLAHGGTTQDRTTAVHLLEESLGFPAQQPVLAGGSKVVLGQLLLSRAMAGMNSPETMMRMMTSGGGGGAADADRAITLFREVADGPQISAELTSSARTLLTVAEALRGMLGGPGGMDLSKLGQALGAMQAMQQQMSGGTGTGVVPPPIPDMAAFSPPPAPFPSPAVPAFGPGLVAVVEGPIPGNGPKPQPRPKPITVASEADLRESLSTAVSVDARVALAAALVETPGAQPADRLALATALIARHHADGGNGWPGGPDDLRAAADCLHPIISALPGMTPGEVEAVWQVAADLDGLAEERGLGRVNAAFAEVTAAMREAQITALVYGPLALSAATGRLEPVTDGASWTGRVVAAGPGIESGGAVSYVRTAEQLVTLIRRGRRPVTEAPVFVANPRRDRETATVDALRLRRAFYPRSTGLGWTVEQNDGDGGREQVAAHLDASLLHLGCGVSGTGALELAGSTLLTPDEIAAAAVKGGVAVLPPGPGALDLLADALLTSGYTSVIGFRERVPDRVASLIYWMLHAALVDDGRDPAAAVAAVRGWLADPEREVPELLAVEYSGTDLSDPAYGRSLICLGL